jgi:hypothetical protein
MALIAGDSQSRFAWFGLLRQSARQNGWGGRARSRPGIFARVLAGGGEIVSPLNRLAEIAEKLNQK